MTATVLEGCAVMRDGRRRLAWQLIPSGLTGRYVFCVQPRIDVTIEQFWEAYHARKSKEDDGLEKKRMKGR